MRGREKKYALLYPTLTPQFSLRSHVLHLKKGREKEPGKEKEETAKGSIPC